MNNNSQNGQRKKILLTNDDGIHASGLKALYKELIQLGDVYVVAPDQQQSGVGLCITYREPLMVHEVSKKQKHFGWAVHGSPADCVKLGILEFCQGAPDYIVSGINSGANTGLHVLYSGTVAAAIEGSFFGVTSFAISSSTAEKPDYDKTAVRTVKLIQKMIEGDLPQGSLWNINFPSSGFGEPKGTKLVSLGLHRHSDVLEKRHDLRGQPYFWTGLLPEREFNSSEIKNRNDKTDVQELANGYVTITPLNFDMTDHSQVGDPYIQQIIDSLD
jgi:5'/3'-nucleotidase